MAGPALTIGYKRLGYGDSIDLLDASEFILDRDSGGYIPAISPVAFHVDPAPVTDTMPTMSDVTGDNAMAVIEQRLNDASRQAAQYINDSTYKWPVWLNIQLSGETNARRSLIHGIGYTPIVSRFNPLASSSGYRHYEHRLIVQRSAYWESPDTVDWDNTFDVLGGTDSGTVAGDAPARLSNLKAGFTTSSQYHDKIWMGYRSKSKIQSITPLPKYPPGIWEIEAGTVGTDTTTTVDATASPGTGTSAVTCTFATTTAWARRVYLLPSDITSNTSSLYGKYMALVRAKLSAGSSEVEIKIKTGVSALTGPEPLKELQTVSATSTNWNMYEMGIVECPAQNVQADYIGDDDLQTFSLWAQRVSGSASLVVDCIVMIPCDEFFISTNANGASVSYVTTNPLNEFFGHSEIKSSNDYIQSTAPPFVVGNGIPGDGQWYFCAGPENAWNDTAPVEIDYYPRYASIRGAG